MLKYPMTLKQVRDFLIKKTEWDGYYLVNIKVDWCFMIAEAVEKTQDDKVYEDDQKILVKKLKEDPRKLFRPRVWKINLCNYVEEYKKQKELRNNRHHQKYGEWLFWEPNIKMKVNIEQEEKQNLDNIMWKLNS